MLKIKNVSTNEVVTVFNVEYVDGVIIAEPRRPHKKAGFYNTYPMLSPLGQKDGRDTMSLSQEWEVVQVKKRSRKSTVKTEPAPEPVTAPVVEPVSVVEPAVEPVVEPEPATVTAQVTAPEPVVEPVAAVKPETRTRTAGVSYENIRKELLEKYGNMGADVFAAAAKLVQAEVASASAPAPVTAQVDAAEVERIVEERLKSVRPTRIEVVAPTGIVKTINASVCKNFNIYCNVVNAGKPLYMYGPAGSGKSYTARQIAEALSLDYYETSQAMFAHELKGYGDAAGNFVETAFYRAFAKGGLFFLDEVDASAPEALVVLNNAIANKRFDFPVIGNVTAHENFRVVAAGNTRMTGATIEYTARQMQDTSFKNRFLFEVVTYDRDVFLAITGGDEEIVNFGADLRRAARNTGISQLFSYRQGEELASLQDAYMHDDAHLLRAAVLQEKEVDDALNLYEHLQDKNNRWAKAMKKCIDEMRDEEVW